MSDDFDDASVTEQPGRALAAAEPSARPRFGLRSLFIATMAICVVLAVLVPTIRASRLASQRIQCSNNMKQIALALHNYHDVHRTFPWAITYAAGWHAHAQLAGCHSCPTSSQQLHAA